MTLGEKYILELFGQVAYDSLINLDLIRPNTIGSLTIYLTYRQEYEAGFGKTAAVYETAYQMRIDESKVWRAIKRWEQLLHPGELD